MHYRAPNVESDGEVMAKIGLCYHLL